MAIEQMLELWCVELRQVKTSLKSLLAHPSVAASAAAFLDDLLGPEGRKTGWMRTEAVSNICSAGSLLSFAFSSSGAFSRRPGNVPSAMFGFAVVEGRPREPVLAADLRCLHPGAVLLEDADDLLLREP